MNIVVTTAACYPTRERIHFLDDSAKRCGINLQPFGIGKPFSNWRQMLLEDTLVAFDSFGTEYSHVLYVDAADTLFIGPMDEILAKYYRAGRPKMLISADNPIPTEGIITFMNAGGFIAEIQFFTELMRDLARRFDDDGDYQNWLHRAWPIRHLDIDHQCEIFQSMDNDHPSVHTVRSRVVNTCTGHWPCVLHFRGGYSDPETGRDYRLKPWVEKLWGATC